MVLPEEHEHFLTPWEYVKAKSGRNEPCLTTTATQLYKTYVEGDDSKLKFNAKSFAKTKKPSSS
jgi:hypothetical protein